MKKAIKNMMVLSLFIQFSCNNEPIDNTSLSPEDPILVDSELYNNIERVTTDDPESELICIDFDYAFTINVFDEEEEFLYPQIVGSDNDFSDFLGSLPPGYIISISYPITYSNDAGESINITNNDELKTLIDACIELDVIEECNNLLTQKNCIWQVQNNPDGDNTYEGAYFDISEAGVASFHHNNEVYYGTWITLFIEEELHINIFFQDDTVGIDWNFDWMVTINDDESMTFMTNDRIRIIEKICEEDPEECSQLTFEECEDAEGSEQALFDLISYIDCFPNELTPNSTATVSFYLTQEDRENDVNEINYPEIFAFPNTSNPQEIFVRYITVNTSEVYDLTIELVTIECE